LQNKKRKAEHPVFCMNFVRTPQHTSVLSGRAWMEELLTGHPKRMRDNMGISQTGFQYLKKLLIEKGGLQRPIYRFHRTAWDILICSDTGSFYEEVGGTISKKHRNNYHHVLRCFISKPLYTSWIKSATNSTPLIRKSNIAGNTTRISTIASIWSRGRYSHSYFPSAR
jgi:hypothetical protein